MTDDELKTKVTEIMREYLKSQAFTVPKLTDNPTDALQAVNRRYVNLYGPTTQRPITSVFGQQYFDSTIGRPIFLNPTTGRWVDGAGSVA